MLCWLSFLGRNIADRCLVTYRGMFIAFCILQIIALSCIWSALVCRWIWHHGLPKISSYPTIDFAMKTHQRVYITRPGGIPTALTSTDSFVYRAIGPAADDGAIRRALKNHHTFIRRASFTVTTSASSISLVGRDKNSSQVALLKRVPSPGTVR